MAQLRQQEGMGARALEFAILCASRSGEVRGAEWSEIDLTAGVWTIPANRMKAEREHRVPLTDDAMTLLKALPRSDDTNLVFPNAKYKPLSDMTLTSVLRRMGVPVTAHGFRSSFRDWARNEHGIPTRSDRTRAGASTQGQGRSCLCSRFAVRQAPPLNG